MEKGETILLIITIAILMFFCVIFTGGLINRSGPVSETQITIRVIEYAEDKYVVWDEDGHPYYVDDHLFEQYRIGLSTERPSDESWLQEGHTYKIIIKGRRSKFFYSTPTLLSYTEIEQ